MLDIVIDVALDLHLLETMLPDGNVWSHTILSVVQENDPIESILVKNTQRRSTSRLHDIHSIGIHRLADIEVVILDVRNDLLRKRLGTGLELLDRIIAGATVLECGLDLLHVVFEMSEVALLVELRVGQSEGVHHIDDCLFGVVNALVAALFG